MNDKGIKSFSRRLDYLPFDVISFRSSIKNDGRWEAISIDIGKIVT